MSQQPKKTGLILGFIGIGMLGLAYASVPLYKLFCQQTGYGGTPKVAVQFSDRVVKNRSIKVQFVSNTHRYLHWHFKPMQHFIDVHPGQTGLAFYEAQNIGNKNLVGMATYNVTPEKAAPYFNKVHCFCFEEQLLKAGQKMLMPVHIK